MDSRLTLECSGFRGSEEARAVKKHLQNWGRSTAILNSLQGEIRKLEASRARLKELPDKSPAEESLEKSYEDRIRNLVTETEEIIAHANAMELYIKALAPEKGQVLRLKFVNDASAEAIASKLYVGRATVFRRQNASLRELADMMKNAGCLFERTAHFIM